MKNSEEAVILQDDGLIFTNIGDGKIEDIGRLDYNPGIILSRIENLPYSNGDILVHNFQTMKTNGIQRRFDDKNNYYSSYRIYSKPCTKTGLMNNLLIKIDSQTGIETEDCGYTFKSFGGHIVNDRVRRVPMTKMVVKGEEYTGSYVDFKFRNRVTFSNDGESIAVAAGDRGVILITEKEILNISNFLSRFPGSWVSSAILADDGFLYIGLSGSGFVIRNSYKDDYSRYYHLLERIFWYEAYTGVQLSNIVSTPYGVWFYAYGRYEADEGKIVRGLFHFDFRTGRLDIINEGKSFDARCTVEYDAENGTVEVIDKGTGAVIPSGGTVLSGTVVVATATPDPEYPDEPEWHIRSTPSTDLINVVYDTSALTIAYSNNRVFVQNTRNSIDIYDPKTLKPIYINPRSYPRRLVMDIVGYNENDYVGYACDQYYDSVNNTVYVNTLFSSQRGIIQLDTFDIGTTESQDIMHPRIRLYKMGLLPFDLSDASDVYNLNGNIVLARLTSNRTLSIVSLSDIYDDYFRSVPLEDIVSSDTRVRISGFEWNDCVKIELLNLNQYCSEFYVIYNIKLGTCSINLNEFGNNDDVDKKILMKSTSTTNVIATEGVIAGDNAISDFGALNVHFNEPVYRSTKSYLCYYDKRNRKEKYVNRMTGEEKKVLDILHNVPENYFPYLGLGIGREDCKVYIAVDNRGQFRLIHEYVTNNRDIIDLPIDGSKVDGYNLLPDGYNSVDRWFIGEFNNTPVGFIYKRDGGGNFDGVRYIVHLGVKEGARYVLDVSESTDWVWKLDNYQIFDDSLSGTKIYCEEMGAHYIVIKKGSALPIDIFGNELDPDQNIRRMRRSVTPIVHGYNIDMKDYFYNLINMKQMGDWVSVRPVTEMPPEFPKYYETGDQLFVPPPLEDAVVEWTVINGEMEAYKKTETDDVEIENNNMHKIGSVITFYAIPDPEVTSPGIWTVNGERVEATPTMLLRNLNTEEGEDLVTESDENIVVEVRAEMYTATLGPEGLHVTVEFIVTAVISFSAVNGSVQLMIEEDDAVIDTSPTVQPIGKKIVICGFPDPEVLNPNGRWMMNNTIELFPVDNKVEIVIERSMDIKIEYVIDASPIHPWLGI